MKVLGSEPVCPVEGFVPASIFEEHERRFPQVTLDIIVTHSLSYLLVRRNSRNSTGRGLWATVGGHLRKNETLDEGASRILEREAGIRSRSFELLGVSQYFDEKVHCVSLVLKTTVRAKSVRLDKTSSEFGWFTSHSELPPLIKYYEEMLTLGGLPLRTGKGSS